MASIEIVKAIKFMNGISINGNSYFVQVGGISYIEWACDLINADELQIFKFILSGGKDNQKYFDTAVDAFKYFVYKENGSGR